MIYEKIANIQKKLRKDGNLSNLYKYLKTENVLLVQPYVMGSEHKPMLKTALIDLEAGEDQDSVFASHMAVPDWSSKYRKDAINALFALDYDKENN